MFRRRVAVAVIVCTTIGMSTALAAIGIPGADNLYHGCLNERTGAVRLLPEGQRCTGTDTPVEWPAKAYVDSALASEAGLRVQGDNAQAAAILNESAARQAADAAGLAAATSYTDQSLQTEADLRQGAIDAESQARAAADASLSTRIDSVASLTAIEDMTCKAGTPEVGKIEVMYVRDEATGKFAMTLVCAPTAHFPLTVTVGGTGAGMVTSVPAGIACGPTAGSGDCSEDYPIGANVTVTASPGAASVADRSVIVERATTDSDCVPPSNALTFVCTMTAPHSATVTFREVARLSLTCFIAVSCAVSPFAIAEVGGGCPFGCLTEILNYAPGTVVTITVTEFDPIRVFDGWNGACAGQGTTCVLTMNSNVSTSPRLRLGGP